jgi:redox-sensing transcriptional repressor
MMLANRPRRRCATSSCPGVRSILASPVVLQVPRGVEVRKVDLAVELQILAFHVTRSTEAQRPGALAVNGHSLNGRGGILT